jgi:hypothetical protein
MCVDQRSPTRFAEFGSQACLSQHIEQKGGAFPYRRVVRADARLPDEGEQGVEAILLVPFQAIVEIVKHHGLPPCLPF